MTGSGPGGFVPDPPIDQCPPVGGQRWTVIPLDARLEWERTLEGLPHAFAHTWTHCRAMHLTTGMPTFLFAWQDGSRRGACAVAERGPEPYLDVVTPYGFGGFTGDAGPEMMGDWTDFAHQRGYVCGYVGLNPVLTPEWIHHSADYVEHNDVYVLDLDRGVDVLYQELSTNRKRQLRAFEAEAHLLTEDRQRLNDYFVAEIEDHLRARGAGPAYVFGRRTWEALLEAENVFPVGVERPDGAIEAVCLFGHTAHCGDYLFSVSSPAGRRYSAALIWAGAMRLAERGVPRLNLGGGIRRRDGVAEFKQRFGARRLPLGALRQVYRPARYEALCRDARMDPSDRSGFFPPYRAPGRTAILGDPRH